MVMNQPTDRQTDIILYRVSIHTKNIISYDIYLTHCQALFENFLCSVDYAAFFKNDIPQVVSRVLLEHCGEPPVSPASSRSSNKTAGLTDCSVDSDRCASFLSMESGRATSYDNSKHAGDKAGMDLGQMRSVNYLDLSKLGNEGETPNSDEIWVTVEDDNKFLTSDTETYSVATDKVSTMATFKGHVVGSGCDSKIALLNSASETELAELGNESLASDLDGGEFSPQQLETLLHNEISPLRARLDSTGRTVTGIADTLYHIQDGINNLCCNVTQMKSKVLSSFESDQTLFPGQQAGLPATGEEKLELVKDGVPVGEPEHLVERMVTKLDSALRRRDEKLALAMQSLEEDNRHLRQELELYRQRESGDHQLENKVQEVLDNMEKLRQRRSVNTTPRSDHNADNDLEAKLPTKFKRRSKSRGKSNSRETSSSGSGSKKEPGVKLKPRRQNAYENDSTTSSDCEPRDKTGEVSVTALQLQVESAQSDASALRAGLQQQRAREAELESQNRDLTERLRLAQLGKVAQQESRQVQTSADTGASTTISVAVNTEPGPPITRLQSPSSSSPDKSSDSPVKDEAALRATKQTVRRSRPREKVKKAGTMEEVTEVGEVHGRGAGVDGGTPSPSPSRENENKKDAIKSDKDNGNNVKEPIEENKVTEPKSEVGKSESGEPSEAVKINNNTSGENVQGKYSKKEIPGNSKAKKVVIADRENNNNENSKSKNNANTKNKNGTKAKTNASKTSKNTIEPTKLAKDDKKSTVIEGDDFRLTITSNQELEHCAISDREDEPGSPRKKIIVTPKTPDRQRKEEKRQEAVAVTKKGGKIPIRQTYIKQKAELPAPQQYPAARPGRDQLPAPIPRNYQSSCTGSSPNYNVSPVALSVTYPMTVNHVGYNHALPATPSQDSDRSLASTNLPVSGRNTGLSELPDATSDVFTMLIKQESRDSNVYDAPTFIPDIADCTRESPDGCYSYVIEGPALSSMSNISDLKQDFDEECSSDGTERDIIREFVLMEDERKGSPFKSYAERMKAKVIREFVKTGSLTPHSLSQKQKRLGLLEDKDRPATRILPARKRVRRMFKSRSQSLSMNNLNDIQTGKTPSRLRKAPSFCSTERLPTLTPGEEERIIRLKKYEDDTEKLNEKRSSQLLRQAEKMKKSDKHKSYQNGQITIYTNRPSTVPEEFKLQNNANLNSELFAATDELNSNCVEGALQQSAFNGDLHNNRSDVSRDVLHGNDLECNTEDGTLSQKRLKLKKFRGLSPMARVTSGKMAGPALPPLSVECFIVSRGWQIDQAQLNNAISRLDGINFVRIQMANTINRVIENIRPHNDVVLIHIGTTELSEACHSITSQESVPGKEADANIQGAQTDQRTSLPCIMLTMLNLN